MKNIVETAIEAGSFNTLVAAVTAAGLVETLSAGEFTVFAPTDEAFAKLPEGTLEGLLADKEKLTAILTYHVAAGKHMAEHVMKMHEVPTLEGANLPVDVAQGVTVGGAKVVQVDIECTNGVIHVIDTVLIPA